MTSSPVLANTILLRAFNEKKPPSLMKLQKLLYLVCLEYTTQTGNLLISEYFEVWETGPVLNRIQEYYKGMSKRIIRFARDATGVVCYEADSLVNQIVDKVWNQYRDVDGISLAEITRQPGGLWYRAYINGQSVINIEEELRHSKATA